MSTWMGPDEADLECDGTTLRAPVPPERWPYGPPDHHQSVCKLHAGGLYCDCAASDASDMEWGSAHAGVCGETKPTNRLDAERQR
jgi:hypothetical protein